MMMMMMMMPLVPAFSVLATPGCCFVKNVVEGAGEVEGDRGEDDSTNRHGGGNVWKDEQNGMRRRRR